MDKLVPVTSADDPRIVTGYEETAGDHQIAAMLAATPRQRLQCLLDMLKFEERAHRSHILPLER